MKALTFVCAFNVAVGLVVARADEPKKETKDEPKKEQAAPKEEKKPVSTMNQQQRHS